MMDMWQEICENDITPLPACLPQGLVHLVNDGCLRKNPPERLDVTSLLAFEVLGEPAKASGTFALMLLWASAPHVH